MESERDGKAGTQTIKLGQIMLTQQHNPSYLPEIND